MTEPADNVRKPYFWEPLFTWKVLRRCVIVLACMVTLIALFYAVEDWRGKRAWNQVRAEWEPKGEKFGTLAYVPEKVSDAQNAVMIPMFTQLFEYTINPTNGSKQLKGDPNPDEFKSFQKNAWGSSLYGQWRLSQKAVLTELQDYYRGTNDYGKHEFPIADKPQKPGEDILLALSRSDAAVNTLKESFKTRPYAQFPVEYQDGLGCLLPHLAKLKGIAQFLRPRSLAELSLNQNEKAFDDIMLSLHLVDSLRTEPILISQLVRIAMLELSIQPIWEGMANHQWNDEQLVSMYDQFAKMNFLSSYKLAMRGERTFCTEYAFDSLIQHGVEPDMWGMGKKEETSFIDQIVPKLVSSMPSGWFRQNEALAVQCLIKMGNVVDAEHHAIDFDSMTKLDKEIIAISTRRTPYTFLCGMLLPAVSKAFLRFSQGQVTADLARVACNLERYRLANGKYPESLDALVPKYMTKVPDDLMSGKPLHYKTKEDGTFELYSVGADRVDNGGKVGMTGKKDPRWDPNSGDWVWRY